MKQTANRGYTYPECNPPYVKDLSDLPAQLKFFAEQVNTDISAVALVAAQALNPPGVSVNRTTAQVLVPGAKMGLDTVLFDNNTMFVVSDQINIKTAGLYVITGTSRTSVAPTVFHNLSIVVNNQILTTNTVNPNSTGGAPSDNNVTGHAILSVGDIVQLSQNFTGAASITYQYAGLGAVRISGQ